MPRHPLYALDSFDFIILLCLSTFQRTFVKNKKDDLFQLVGLNGLEPSTSRLSGVCSNQLSYRPSFFFFLKKEKLIRTKSFKTEDENLKTFP